MGEEHVAKEGLLKLSDRGEESESGNDNGEGYRGLLREFFVTSVRK